MTNDGLLDELDTLMKERRFEMVVSRCRGKADDELLSGRFRPCLRMYASALLRAGHLHEAITQYERLIELIPTQRCPAGDWCELAAAYLADDSYEHSVKCVRRAMKCNYAEDSMNLATRLVFYYVSVRGGNVDLRDEATRELEAKLDAGAKSWPAPLARLLLNKTSQDDIQRQIESMHSVRQPDQFCRFYFYNGVKLLDSEMPSEARNWFDKAVEQKQQRTSTTELAMALHELGRI